MPRVAKEKEMAVPMETTIKKTRKPRRSPEELLAELDKKRQRLERRVMKKNQEAVFAVGSAFLRITETDLATLDSEVVGRLVEDPKFAREFVQGLR